MREVIEWLRQQAVGQKEMAKAFYMTGDMPREHQMRARLADDYDRAADLLEAIAEHAGDFESVREHLMDSGRALLSSSPSDAERYQAAEAVLRAVERSA